ncbi:hypothetical protein [Acidithiobacillus sp.]|uniref:hypothetical protein n=1 Tax=Acidithiobacillus sp. TaxID=1872118 RepID=UPI0025C5B125|nr:hypothetical protein [Acidithiobacillus sp.]
MADLSISTGSWRAGEDYVLKQLIDFVNSFGGRLQVKAQNMLMFHISQRHKVSNLS